MSEYSIIKTGKLAGRVQNNCRECTRFYKKQWTLNNREKWFANGKRSWTTLRRLVLETYSHGTPRCACCGETTYQFLSLDHINGGGSAHQREAHKQGTRVYQLVKNAGFPPGYQVLCHNCNMAKGFYGQCPHQAAPTYELCGAAI
mgnify:CR=1 FL=1